MNFETFCELLNEEKGRYNSETKKLINPLNEINNQTVKVAQVLEIYKEIIKQFNLSADFIPESIAFCIQNNQIDLAKKLCIEHYAVLREKIAFAIQKSNQ